MSTNEYPTDEAREKLKELQPIMPKGFARRIPLDLTSPCHPWRGAIRTHGYGVLKVDGQEKYAHRLAYQLHVGPIPNKWQVDHACHNAADCPGGPCEHRSCWNPAHLVAVTCAANLKAGANPNFVTSRTQVCRKGHDLAIEGNFYERPDGRKRCAVCVREGQARRRRADSSGVHTGKDLLA